MEPKILTSQANKNAAELKPVSFKFLLVNIFQQYFTGSTRLSSPTFSERNFDIAAAQAWKLVLTIAAIVTFSDGRLDFLQTTEKSMLFLKRNGIPA